MICMYKHYHTRTPCSLKRLRNNERIGKAVASSGTSHNLIPYEPALRQYCNRCCTPQVSAGVIHLHRVYCLVVAVHPSNHKYLGSNCSADVRITRSRHQLVPWCSTNQCGSHTPLQCLLVGSCCPFLRSQISWTRLQCHFGALADFTRYL